MNLEKKVRGLLDSAPILPYLAVEHGFSQVHVTLPPAKLILGHLNFVLPLTDSVPSLRMACPLRQCRQVCRPRQEKGAVNLMMVTVSCAMTKYPVITICVQTVM